MRGVHGSAGGAPSRGARRARRAGGPRALRRGGLPRGRAQVELEDKTRRELGWKAAQENRLAWQEKLSNQQHERNRAVEGKLLEQQRKNSSDVATNTLLEARMRARPRPAPRARAGPASPAPVSARPPCAKGTRAFPCAHSGSPVPAPVLALPCLQARAAAPDKALAPGGAPGLRVRQRAAAAAAGRRGPLPVRHPCAALWRRPKEAARVRRAQASVTAPEQQPACARAAPGARGLTRAGPPRARRQVRGRAQGGRGAQQDPGGQAGRHRGRHGGCAPPLGAPPPATRPRRAPEPGRPLRLPHQVWSGMLPRCTCMPGSWEACTAPVVRLEAGKSMQGSRPSPWLRPPWLVRWLMRPGCASQQTWRSRRRSASGCACTTPPTSARRSRRTCSSARPRCAMATAGSARRACAWRRPEAPRAASRPGAAAVHGAPARGQRVPSSRGRSDRRSPCLPAFFAAERAAPTAAPG